MHMYIHIVLKILDADWNICLVLFIDLVNKWQNQAQVRLAQLVRASPPRAEGPEFNSRINYVFTSLLHSYSVCYISILGTGHLVILLHVKVNM